EHVLLEVLFVPMIDVGGGGAHGHAIGRKPVEIIGSGFDHGGAEQADALAPAEGLVGRAHCRCSLEDGEVPIVWAATPYMATREGACCSAVRASLLAKIKVPMPAALSTSVSRGRPAR